jgi:hypothetical protein
VLFECILVLAFQEWILVLAEMNCVSLEIGGFIPGLETNRMSDASHNVKESVAREGGIFGFFLCLLNGCVCFDFFLWFGNRCGVFGGFL